jgi:hypothetical protein
MNIFLLDEHIDKCVEYHVDKHVNKMRVELAQLASCAHWAVGSTAPYRKTHFGHPSSVWTRESTANYLYVVNLGLKLCEEMRYRFGTKYQKTEDALLWLAANVPPLPSNEFTKPRLAIGSQPEMLENDTPMSWAVRSYRQYYIETKQHLYKWTKRETPFWLQKKD